MINSPVIKWSFFFIKGKKLKKLRKKKQPYVKKESLVKPWIHCDQLHFLGGSWAQFQWSLSGLITARPAESRNHLKIKSLPKWSRSLKATHHATIDRSSRTDENPWHCSSESHLPGHFLASPVWMSKYPWVTLTLSCPQCIHRSVNVCYTRCFLWMCGWLSEWGF